MKNLVGVLFTMPLARRHVLPPAPTRATLIAMLWALAAACAAPAQQRAAVVQVAAEPLKLREPEEKALRAFIEKLAEAKRRLYLDEMRQTAQTLAGETGLDELAAKRLEEGFTSALDAAMTGWEEKAYDWLSPFVGRSANAIRDMARWPVEQIARSPGVKDVTPPWEQPVWLDFLRGRLSAEQWRVWQEKLERDARELEQRVAEHVEFASENQRPLMESETSLACTDIVNILALAPERAARLDQLARQAVDAALARWREAALKNLREMDRERREAVITHGGGIAIEEEFHPCAQPVWIEGLASLLDAEERGQVEQALQARQARRLDAARLAILQLIDERAALSADQRSQMLPLLEEAAGKLTEQMRRYYNLDPNMVGHQLRQCDLEPLRALLEPAQLRGLDRLLDPTPRRPIDADALDAARDLPPPQTEEELERLLSEDLLRRYDEARRERLEDMRTHVEDLRRHARLSAAQEQTLELAMHGAVQDSLALFRQQVSTWLRQSMAGASGPMVRQRLLNLGTAGFGNDVPPKDTEFWQCTLARVLNDSQREAWAQAQNARENELRRAQVLLVVSELEQQLALTAKQAAFFEQRLAEIIAEYAEDLDQYRGARRWHLHAYSMLTPVVGIPEEEMQRHLTETQMELWREKSENQLRHYWDGVKRNHDNRLKARKEGGS